MELTIVTAAELAMLFTDILLQAEKYMKRTNRKQLLVSIDTYKSFLFIDINKEGDYEYHTISFEETMRLNKAGVYAIPVGDLAEPVLQKQLDELAGNLGK